MDKQLYRLILSLVSLLFLLGIGAGALLAYRADTGPDSGLRAFLMTYAGLLSDGTAVNTPVWRCFFNAFLFPALAVLSGLTLAGVVAIPLLLLIKGFLLSFVFTAFVSTFGVNGLWLALGELGIQCLLGVPCLIVLSVYSAHMALHLLAMARGTARGGPLFSRPLMARFAVCAVVLTACALADAFLSPMLRGWISSLTL